MCQEQLLDITWRSELPERDGEIPPGLDTSHGLCCSSFHFRSLLYLASYRILAVAASHTEFGGRGPPQNENQGARPPPKSKVRGR